MNVVLWAILVGVTVIPSRPMVQPIEVGRVEHAQFVWIGGTDLSGTLTFSADTLIQQVFVTDESGQRYPLIVREPVVQPVFTAADSERVERAAPGLMDFAANARREAFMNRIVAHMNTLLDQGYSDEQTAELLLADFRREPTIDWSKRDGRSITFGWRKWRMKSSFDVIRPSPVSRLRGLQSFVEGMQVALKNGSLVVLGWSGSYTAIPSKEIGQARQEITHMRQGILTKPVLIRNGLVAGPIQLRLTRQDWLRRAQEQ